MILFGTPCAVPRRQTHSFTKTPSMTLTPMPACDGQVHFIQIGRNFSSKTVSSNDTFIPNPFQIGPLPPLDLPHPNRPKIRAFFPLPPHFRSIFCLGCILVDLWPRVAAMNHPNCAFGLFFVKPRRPVGRRGSHKMTPDPPFEPSPFWAPHSSGPHPSGPQPSGSQPVGPRNWTKLSLDEIVCG